MNITIASHTFDQVHYDRDGDVLYLHIGDPNTDADWDETPEGHGLSFNAAGELVGLTIVRPRTLLDRHGTIEITLPPQHINVDRPALNEVLLAA